MTSDALIKHNVSWQQLKCYVKDIPLMSCARRYVSHDMQHFKSSVNCSSNIPLVEKVSNCVYDKDGQDHIIDHPLNIRPPPPPYQLVVCLVILMINFQACNSDFPYLTKIWVLISSTIILQTFALYQYSCSSSKIVLKYLFHFDDFPMNLLPVMNLDSFN